jgi:glyoxylase-like metal-dependent hydrolase (beta-lactamase superfamily II)
MSKGKKVALALGVAALVAGASRIPYRAVSVAGAKPPAAPYALPPAREGLRLHVFNTGANRVSSLLVGANPAWRPAPAFVIQHPVHGSIVFDLGLSQAVAERGEAALDAPMRWLFQSRGRVGRTLEAQMREVGLEPADVRWVIVSHLHEDHLGAASAFTKATFVGGAGVSAHRFGLADEPRWREVDFAHGQSLPPFDATYDLFGDRSVVLIRGGGHAREDVMALLALPGGPALLAGDAVVHRDWLRSDDVERIATDPARAADVRNQVRALAAAVPGLALLPGHDLRELPGARADLVLHHPEWFHPAAWPIGAR